VAVASATVVGVTAIWTIGAKVDSVRPTVLGVTSRGAVTVGVKAELVRASVVGVAKRGVLTVGSKVVSLRRGAAR
jgi:hypothetical protein